jgi:hypothetical protein
LVQQALASTTGEQPEIPPGGLTDKPEVEGAGPTASTLTAPEQSPEGDITIEVRQATREVRWRPRIVDARPQQVPQAHVPAVINAPTAAVPAKAQPVARPVEDDKPYDMPEDIKAFNEFWVRAEHSLKRPLEYKEVIVQYNRYRHAFENSCDHED